MPRTGASECTDMSHGAAKQRPLLDEAERVTGNNRVTPPRHDGHMVNLSKPSEARRLQGDRRRYIEQRRQWGTRMTWPQRPARGWLAEVREASGLSTRDLAQRLGVEHSTVVRVEASEGRDTVQLGVLRRYADAMDADLRYVILPRASVLQTTDSQGRARRSQLRLKANRRRQPERQPQPQPQPPSGTHHVDGSEAAFDVMLVEAGRDDFDFVGNR
jgi:transcriptional regulator with XRE-family HTH domain